MCGTWQTQLYMYLAAIVGVALFPILNLALFSHTHVNENRKRHGEISLTRRTWKYKYYCITMHCVVYVSKDLAYLWWGREGVRERGLESVERGGRMARRQERGWEGGRKDELN